MAKTEKSSSVKKTPAKKTISKKSFAMLANITMIVFGAIMLVTLILPIFGRFEVAMTGYAYTLKVFEAGYWYEIVGISFYLLSLLSALSLLTFGILRIFNVKIDHKVCKYLGVFVLASSLIFFIFALVNAIIMSKIEILTVTYDCYVLWGIYILAGCALVQSYLTFSLNE